MSEFFSTFSYTVILHTIFGNKHWHLMVNKTLEIKFLKESFWLLSAFSADSSIIVQYWALEKPVSMSFLKNSEPLYKFSANCTVCVFFKILRGKSTSLLLTTDSHNRLTKARTVWVRQGKVMVAIIKSFFYDTVVFRSLQALDLA